jgi:hypothetical protein
MLDNQPHYDGYQFDTGKRRRRGLYDDYAPEEVARMQIFQAHHRAHKQPAWLESREALLAHLMPRIERLPPHMDKQGTLMRWLTVIHMYFILEASARHIADETGMTKRGVEKLIYTLRH